MMYFRLLTFNDGLLITSRDNYSELLVSTIIGIQCTMSRIMYIPPWSSRCSRWTLSVTSAIEWNILYSHCLHHAGWIFCEKSFGCRRKISSDFWIVILRLDNFHYQGEYPFYSCLGHRICAEHDHYAGSIALLSWEVL